MWLTQLESLRPTLAAWNLAIQRSMDDYHAHPTASCRRPSCDRLAETNGLCRSDERDRRAAMRRTRVRRGGVA